MIVADKAIGAVKILRAVLKSELLDATVMEHHSQSYIREFMLIFND